MRFAHSSFFSPQDQLCRFARSSPLAQRRASALRLLLRCVPVLELVASFE